MDKSENAQNRETTTNVIIDELADEKNNLTFVKEYLKAGFLSSAIDALFHARRQTGLTQAQVAEHLNTKQAAIARLEADTDGSLSLRRYIDFALTCGMVPLNIVLVPIDSVRALVINHPEAQLTQEVYNMWIKKAPVFQDTALRIFTNQAMIDVNLSRKTADFAEKILKEQYSRQASYALPQQNHGGAINTTFVCYTSAETQTTNSSVRSAASLINEVAA